MYFYILQIILINLRNMLYDYNKIEEEARKKWNDNNVYKVSTSSIKPKYYVLDMFPYPSGAGLPAGQNDLIVPYLIVQVASIHFMIWSSRGEVSAVKTCCHSPCGPMAYF